MLDFKAAASAVLDRFMFLRQAGITFKGARDLYEILGYDRVITTKDYRDRFARGGIAKRIVEALPNATWRGDFELIEDEDPKVSTQFEETWDLLNEKHQIQAKLRRTDILAGLSTYAVLLIGARDDLQEELPKGKPDDLLYLTPFSGGGGPGIAKNSQSNPAIDADATILEYDLDVTSPRFGLPKLYQLRRVDIQASSLHGVPVHWTRIIHIAEGLLDDEIFGIPTLEACWNLLDDLDKVTGGGSEAFWLRANQGLHLNVDTDVKQLSDADKNDLKTQADEYQHQLRRIIRTRGVEINALGSDVAMFSNPADAILTQIAGTKGIPKRILTGSEMGELASTQDRDNWKDQINGRQRGYAGPYIVRPLVDRLIQYGYLPTPKQYEVQWPHIQVLTEQEKADGAQKWAETNRVQGMPVFTAAEIRDHWYGMEPLTDEEIKKEQPEPVTPVAETPNPNQPDVQIDKTTGDIRFPKAAAWAGQTDIHPEWQILREGLSRRFTFADRRQCASFLASLMRDANLSNHHPEVETIPNGCVVTYVTHSAGDTITELDWQAAYRADQIAATYDPLDAQDEQIVQALEAAILDNDLDQIAEIIGLGGAGSGNFGHEGRPGQVGGSSVGGSSRVGLTPGAMGTPTAMLAPWRAARLELQVALGGTKSTDIHVEDAPNTIQAATITADVLKEMRGKGYRMPVSVNVQQWDRSLAGNTEEYGRSPDRHLNIMIPATLPQGANLDDVVKVTFGGMATAENKGLGWVTAGGGGPIPETKNFAVQNFRDVVIHEMGHVQSKTFTPTVPETMNDIEMFKAAWTVSAYAAKEPVEFLAEAFVRQYHGEKLTPEAMKLYKALEGPAIR